ncbi:photosystem I P700 chlorophyll A apoprotein A2, chloroplastic [Tanacetum coccineum]
MNSQLRQKLQRGGPRPGKGRVAEWSKEADCKSVEVFLRRFESCLSYLFVVDSRDEKRGICQRRKANRAKLLWLFREVQLYRMLVRENSGLARESAGNNRKEGVHVAAVPAPHLSQWGSSIASMILGALAAMAQTKVKRLLAHNSIGHVGYICTGFSCGTIEGIQSLLIGIFIYASMKIDAFAIVSALRQRRGSKPFFNIEGDGESGQNGLAFLIEQIQEKNHIENAPNLSPSFIEPCIGVSMRPKKGNDSGCLHCIVAGYLSLRSNNRKSKAALSYGQCPLYCKEASLLTTSPATRPVGQEELPFLVLDPSYTNFGIGHSMKDLLDAHIPPGGRLGRGHKGLYDTIQNSIHFQLGLALASLGVITSLVAQHMSFAHGAIFFIRDYNPEQNEDNVLARMLEHKEAIISHLSWASLFLGFHTLGLYVHNDVMLAFGPGDFLVHHVIALGLHITTLILVKGALDTRGSKLILDKKDFSSVQWPKTRRTLHYGRELIETLAWAHERTPLANLIRWREKPVALSIVQARLLGLAHFSVGYILTYAVCLASIFPGLLLAREIELLKQLPLLLELLPKGGNWLLGRAAALGKEGKVFHSICESWYLSIIIFVASVAAKPLCCWFNLAGFTSSLSFCMVLKRKSGCPDIEEFFLQIEAGNLVGESLSANLVGGTCSTLTSLFHNTSQPAYLEGADTRREEKGQGVSMRPKKGNESECLHCIVAGYLSLRSNNRKSKAALSYGQCPLCRKE